MCIPNDTSSQRELLLSDNKPFDMVDVCITLVYNFHDDVIRLLVVFVRNTHYVFVARVYDVKTRCEHPMCGVAVSSCPSCFLLSSPTMLYCCILRVDSTDRECIFFLMNKYEEKKPTPSVCANRETREDPRG